MLDIVKVKTKGALSSNIRKVLSANFISGYITGQCMFQYSATGDFSEQTSIVANKISKITHVERCNSPQSFP